MRESIEIRARCDDKHRKALQAIAKHEGIKSAEALRLLVREKARALGVWPGQRKQAA
jgi:hypothetical protein